MRTLSQILCLSLALLFVFLCGRYSAELSVAHELNDLLQVGFTILDPEGYEIERFDDSPEGLLHSTFLPR